MRQQHPGTIQVPEDLYAETIVSAEQRDENERRRRDRFHLPWEEQRRLAAIDARPASARQNQSEWDSFNQQVDRQLLSLFASHGIEIPVGDKPDLHHWRRLAILQAIRQNELNIRLDGKPLPVRATSEDIDSAASVKNAAGKQLSPGRTELIKGLLRDFYREAVQLRPRGRDHKTVAAKRTVEELKKHYPGEYLEGNAWESIRTNYGKFCESASSAPVSDATLAYMTRVLKAYDLIEGIAARLVGKQRPKAEGV